MPSIRKLSPEEVTSRETSKLSQRQQTARQYDALLADFAPGEWAEVELDDGDNRLTVRNRLQAAAERRGFNLAFRRTSGNMVRFAIEEAPAPTATEEPATSDASEPTSAPKKRGRKSAGVAA